MTDSRFSKWWRKMTYNKQSNFLLNNFTLEIRDPEIRREFE